MGDPFLLAHLVAPGIFELGGLSPTSIRDQMIRARTLVDRALESGLIDTDKRGLLVVGAGVAGATAGVRAVQRGVSTTVIEATSIPFFRQASCASRWIDPTQYDWPVGHWRKGHYPWSSPSMPFGWNANFSNQLALDWEGALNIYRAKYTDRLSVKYETVLDGIPAHGPDDFVQVHLKHNRRVSSASNFGAVILTRSFDIEDVSVGNYSGYEFWDTDPFASPRLELPSGVAPKILISGAGDGGLQDLLRILTQGASARKIYESIYDPHAAEWTMLENVVRDAEDQAQRAHSWGNEKLHDHPVFLALESAHEEAISLLQSNSRIWNDVQRIVDRFVGTPPDVTIMHRCSHFGSSYPLNRFLVLLLKRVLSVSHANALKFRAETQMVSVRGVYHQCTHDPAACHGKPHQVSVQTRRCGGSEGISVPDDHEYNVVIIRHGARMISTGRTEAARPRQLLPFHASA